jgi:Ca2+-binding RTX toxin-like protein
VAGNKGDDAVYGGNGSDSVFGGWGADRIYGGDGNDLLHALAPDGQPDLLNCGRGDDKAYVLRSERPSTRLVGCEALYVVVSLTDDQAEGENSDADAEAEG